MGTTTSRQKIKALAVRVEVRTDDSPDTSYLGEYTDTPYEGAIDRASADFCGDIDRRRALIEDIRDSIDYDDVSAARAAKLGRRIERIERTGETEYGPRGRHYRFFLPYAGGEKWQNGRNKEYRTYAMQDYKRMEGLNNGDWAIVGIVAKAEILVGDTIQTIHSAGLWGVESDADDYIQQMAKEQLADLAELLAQVGPGKRAIAHAIKSWGGELTYR